MGCLPHQHHNGLDELHHEDRCLGMTGQNTLSSLTQPPTYRADMMNRAHRGQKGSFHFCLSQQPTVSPWVASTDAWSEMKLVCRSSWQGNTTPGAHQCSPDNLTAPGSLSGLSSFQLCSFGDVEEGDKGTCLHMTLQVPGICKSSHWATLQSILWGQGDFKWRGRHRCDRDPGAITAVEWTDGSITLTMVRLCRTNVWKPSHRNFMQSSNTTTIRANSSRVAWTCTEVKNSFKETIHGTFPLLGLLLGHGHAHAHAHTQGLEIELFPVS